MLEVTPRAAEHLVGVRKERGFSQSSAARFIPMSNGVGMSFTSEKKPGDGVIKGGSIDIYVPNDVATTLDGSTLDVREKDGRQSLVLRRRARRRR